jgi:cell division protease FtsH
MNGKVGNVSFHDSQQEYTMSKPYSDATAEMIDREVRIMIEEQYNRAKDLLRSRMSELKALAEELLKKEVIFKDDLERLIGKRPYDDNQTTDVQPAADSLPVSEALKNKENVSPSSNAEDQAAGAATTES